MIGTPLANTNYEYRHLPLEVCDSTNTQCMNFAREGELTNLWVTAKNQNASRGSRGREWVSHEGNLFASLMLRNPAALDKLFQLTFVTAVSLNAAISEISGDHSIANKWPNDVMINGKKCSGILLESCKLGNDNLVVIGIGVNCLSYPQDTLHTATSLAVEGIECSASKLFDVIAIQMARHIYLWDKGNNFSVIRNLWLEKVFGLKQEVCIKRPDTADLNGIFKDVDDSGFMLLELPDKTIKKISAADIFFN